MDEGGRRRKRRSHIKKHIKKDAATHQASSFLTTLSIIFRGGIKIRKEKKKEVTGGDD